MGKSDCDCDCDCNCDCDCDCDCDDMNCGYEHICAIVQTDTDD